MKSVFILCSPRSINQGHGEFSDELLLANESYGKKLLPVFSSREAAEAFNKKHVPYWTYTVIELDILDESSVGDPIGGGPG